MTDHSRLPEAPGRYMPLSEDEPYARAYLPDNLPPTLELSEDTIAELARAMHELGRLDGLVSEVEAPGAVFSSLVYKEAEQSSRVEGTDVTISDIYRLAVDGPDPPESDHERDVRAAKNYGSALDQVLEYLGTAGRSRESLSVGLVEDLHETLVERGRTDQDDPRPGEFRGELVHVGETNGVGAPQVRYVPPPPDVIESEMTSLMRYARTGRGWPDLVDVALVHYQFQAIHPFRDGTGRVGRLLDVVMLLCSNLLVTPVICPSSYVRRHRDEYTDRLIEVSEQGAWQEWLQFFLEGVREQAADAFVRAKLLARKRDEYRESYESGPDSLRMLATSLFTDPYVTVPDAAETIGRTYPTANRVVERLVEDGVVDEITGNDQNRVFRATEILDIVERPSSELPSPVAVMAGDSSFELHDL